jgi:methylenetetrahydrofolate reductase (NADPH)
MTSPFARNPLFADFSVVTGWNKAPELAQAGAAIPPGTRVLLGFTDMADVPKLVAAVRTVKALGFKPEPVIAARRLASAQLLRDYLAGVREAGPVESALVVGGDLDQARGPYPDATSVISSGLLEEYGVREVSLAGHPGGHPAAADDVMWQALAAKVAMLAERGLDASITTQFGFDPAVVLTWLASLRARGITVPARVDVAGPASARELLRVAARCGVSVSPDAARRYYGFSVADADGVAGPQRFLRALADGYDPRLHGEVTLRFETFGGVPALAECLRGLD